VANATATCVSGACSYACNSGYTPCNGQCILTNPITGPAVFVAPGGGSGACGSEAAPCGTIAAGLAQIASSGGTKNFIYLANGTYTEQVTLPAGITIQGGWLDTGGSWTHQCVANPQAGAVIAAPAGATSTVVVNYATGSSTLDTLTVQNTNTAAAGQSLYGVMVNGGSATQLVLSNVAMNVSAGGAGGPGAAGGAGAAGATGTCPAASNGATGSNGPGGGPGGAGIFGSAGYVPASGGSGVAYGSTGNNGVAPQQTCTTATDQSDDGSCGGTCTGTSGPCCNTAGGCGNGGKGGATGVGGNGGGSSIGLYVYAGAVTMTGTSITTGAGGNGGTGGQGGAGGGGATGPSGAPGIYHSGCPSSCCCVCKTVANTCEPAGVGSTGGAGGQGGSGAGGSGGDSYCWATSGGGTVTSTSGTCSNGTPGNGGAGGAAGPGGGGAGATGTPGSAGTHN
jgi:hypothetical protein